MAASIPVRDHGFDLAVAGQPLDSVVIRQFERFETAEDVGRLPNHQPEVTPVDGDILELQGRAALLVIRLAPIEGGRGQRDPGLHAPLHAQKLDLHVGSRRQIGLGVLELAQLPNLARFGARRTFGGPIRRWICLR